jgi:molybdopterin molybdotransferase
VKDLVPVVLADLGVGEHFHQVRVKPGKPLWFGTRDAGGRRALVFGLPGNPVSTFVSFKLFVEPALAALSGAEFAAPRMEGARLAAPFKHRGGRPTYQPCRVRSEEASPPGRGGSAAADTGQRIVEPLDWKGSADVATLTRADCLAAMPEGDYVLAPGDEVNVLLL